MYLCICLSLFLVCCDGSSGTSQSSTKSQSIIMDNLSGGILNGESNTSLIPLIVLKDNESHPNYDLNANTVLLTDNNGDKIPVNDLILEQNIF